MKACARCGTRSELALCPACLLADDAPPRLGELELLEEIGRGGMGHVWRAHDPRLQRDVAVKFLPPDADARERLRREARALARLDHPGIVRVHGFGEDEEQAWLVMELVDGRPLSELAPLPVERALELGQQVAEALGAAHAQGVVHRDVKPQNVLVDAQGRARLVDFGIARRADPGAGDVLTRTGMVAGSPPYMPPEAFRGAAPDPRLDVYALGAVLRDVCAGPVPPALDAVLRRATDPDPARRPADGAALAADLAALRRAPKGALPPEEQTLLHAVALLHTFATAAALWAIVQSVTPRVLDASALGPLVMLDPEPLANGRFVSRARFETWPVLVAVAAAVVALAGHGLLRRHWRHAGLEAHAPDTDVPAARGALGLGALACTLFVVRHLVGGSAVLRPYVPVAGGLLELAIVFLAWTAVLEAWRAQRPLASLRALWAGLLLALVPPVTDLLRFLARWHA